MTVGVKIFLILWHQEMKLLREIDHEVNHNELVTDKKSCFPSIFHGLTVFYQNLIAFSNQNFFRCILSQW